MGEHEEGFALAGPRWPRRWPDILREAWARGFKWFGVEPSNGCFEEVQKLSARLVNMADACLGVSSP